MARFDVTRPPVGPDLYLDCQANLFRHMQTRLVVPLRPLDRTPPPVRRLNPVFTVGDRQWLMLTQAPAAIPVRELGLFVLSLENEEFAIGNALDLLIYGI